MCGVYVVCVVCCGEMLLYVAVCVIVVRCVCGVCGLLW